jgi:cytochrome P450
VYVFGSAVYNAYIHPASKFPGPKLWSAFHIFKDMTCANGNIDNRLCELHARYGPVVRISPDELSFVDQRAWKDIYAHPNYLAKWPRFAFVHNKPDTPADIINSTHADHARIRRQLSHAFSEKALREQEDLITSYISLLIEKLSGAAENGSKLNMVKWYNFTTFDIVSDLAFGEPFHCLASGEYHPWVSSIFKNIRIFNIIRSFAAYPGAKVIIGLLASSELRAARKIYKEYSRKTVLKRLSHGTMQERRDFMSYTLKHKEEDGPGMTEGEIIRTASTLIIAGSETTATLLSGVTYFLSTNPNALRKVGYEPNLIRMQHSISMGDNSHRYHRLLRKFAVPSRRKATLTSRVRPPVSRTCWHAWMRHCACIHQFHS